MCDWHSSHLDSAMRRKIKSLDGDAGGIRALSRCINASRARVHNQSELEFSPLDHFSNLTFDKEPSIETARFFNGFSHFLPAALQLFSLGETHAKPSVTARVSVPIQQRPKFTCNAGGSGEGSDEGVSQHERGAASIMTHCLDHSDESDDEDEWPTVADLISGKCKGNVKGRSSTEQSRGSQGSAAFGSAAITNDIGRVGSRDLPILLGDDEDGGDGSDTGPDATPATAAATDDNDDPSISAPPVDVEALPSSSHTLPAEDSVNHPAGQPLVCAANDSGTIRKNYNDIQAGWGIPRDATDAGEYEQYGRPGVSQEDELLSSQKHSLPAAAEGNVYDVFAEYEESFGDISKGRKPRRGREQVTSSAHSADPKFGDPHLATMSSVTLAQSDGEPGGRRYIAADPAASMTASLDPNRLPTVQHSEDGPMITKLKRQQKQRAASTVPLPTSQSRKRQGLAIPVRSVAAIVVLVVAILMLVPTLTLSGLPSPSWMAETLPGIDAGRLLAVSLSFVWLGRVVLHYG
ncbi:hypothetical protein NA57DRAFT_62170 [Rhizodiscina lignyota]|uniref:Uncharacterized protein n=1 Tax=Rhizodiscina lignyota TaxID=1504668 RepID=A0A9P4M0U5_9PEZI|nr:hypothetical protein NA57DRAFT_62170 [Rhizodiscina lignyota]